LVFTASLFDVQRLKGLVRR